MISILINYFFSLLIQKLYNLRLIFIITFSFLIIPISLCNIISLLPIRKNEVLLIETLFILINKRNVLGLISALAVIFHLRSLISMTLWSI
jgi:hypothetical protein